MRQYVLAARALILAETPLRRWRGRARGGAVEAGAFGTSDPWVTARQRQM